MDQFFDNIQTSWQSYSFQVQLLRRKDEKWYLILVLFGSLRLCWGVGEVLWTFVELVLHCVDGMATGEWQHKFQHQCVSMF